MYSVVMMPHYVNRVRLWNSELEILHMQSSNLAYISR